MHGGSLARSYVPKEGYCRKREKWVREKLEKLLWLSRPALLEPYILLSQEQLQAQWLKSSASWTEELRDVSFLIFFQRRALSFGNSRNPLGVWFLALGLGGLGACLLVCLSPPVSQILIEPGFEVRWL